MIERTLLNLSSQSHRIDGSCAPTALDCHRFKIVVVAAAVTIILLLRRLVNSSSSLIVCAIVSCCGL